MPAIAKLLSISAFRWIIAYSAVFSLASAGVIGYIFWHTNDLLSRQVMQTLAAEAKGLREQFNLGGIKLLASTIEERSLRPGSSLYLLTGPDGVRLAGNLTGLPAELAEGEGSGSFRYARRRDQASETRQAVGAAIQVPGGYRLVVGRDVEDQRAFAETTRAILLWGLGLIAALGLGGGLIASRGILRRVDAVTATTERIMAGDLSGRVAVTGSGDELDRLARSLNAMLERIEQLMAGLREVSDNIAHDLKTPLGRLRSRAEAALREGGGSGVHREALERNIEEADDLIRTFDAMLAIARLEAGAAGENMVAADLAELVREAAELYEPVAEEAGFRIAVAGEPGIVVKADRQLLGQAVVNLLDNAIKHGPDAAAADEARTIAVRAESKGKQAFVIVADHGRGIAEADRERALKRFVRLEASRSRPGSGLGLSLVAAVARQHGGGVRLEDNEPGLRVVLSLPRLPATSAASPAAARTAPAAMPAAVRS